MYDQVIIGNKASYDDFGASMAGRSISPPTKKSIKETVPYSNVTYDFSAVNGELYWEERSLDYTFEIIAHTPEELEELKAAFCEWIMNISGAEIHDPFIRGYHFVGTYEDMSIDDDEGGEKTTITVTFSAYPYKVANTVTAVKRTVPAASQVDLAVVNGSSHRIAPTITIDGELTVSFNGSHFTLSAGTYSTAGLFLAAGINAFTVKNSGSDDSTITISFVEEVF